VLCGVFVRLRYVVYDQKVVEQREVRLDGEWVDRMRRNDCLAFLISISIS
jgi:hypothetical protein